MEHDTDTAPSYATAADRGATGPADPGPYADAPVGPVPQLGVTAPPRFALYRSRTDRMLGGVAGGLAAALDADAALLRVLFVALTLITGGAAALVYLAAWVLAPEA